MIDEYKETFRYDGYVVVRNFLPKEFCDFCVSYFKLRGESLDWYSDTQASNSKSFYGDPLTETILMTSCEFMKSITDVSLLPTYSFTRIYSQKDELKIHRDRPECEYSATLCLGRPSEESNTPIYFSKNDIKSHGTPILMEPGDLCVYRGTELYHWRDPIQSAWYLQTFLHYVDEFGEHSHQKYDGRICLGIKK